MWFIKKAIVAFHIFQRRFFLICCKKESSRDVLYHTICQAKFFSLHPPFFLLALIFYPSFSFSILLTPEDKFVAGFSLKPLKKTLQIEVVWRDFTAMIQIDMNLDFESYFSGGCFFLVFSSIAALEPYRGGTIITHFIPSKVSPSIKPTMK